MSDEIRGIQPAESEAVIRAAATGFGEHLSERDVAIERGIFEPDRALVAADGDLLVGATQVCSLELSVPGGSVPTAGVTSVAVLPTHRRRGILTRMMRRLAAEGREREPVSALWASEGGIYGRFGYGMATQGAEFQIERQHTAFRQGVAPGGSIRLASLDEALKVFPPIFERVAAGQPGFLSRNDAWWRYRFAMQEFRKADGYGREHFFAVHESGAGPDGYAAYRMKHDWHEDGHAMRIVELVAATPDAYADLWRFCFDVDLVQKVQAWLRSPWEALPHLLADPNRLKIWIHDGLWVRLFDVGAALEVRRYGTDGSLVIEVADPFCPWNEGRYELSGGPDGASCRRTTADPDLSVQASDLGAAYLGGVGFRRLARAGLAVGDAEALARADAMFGWDPPPWCPFVF